LSQTTPTSGKELNYVGNLFKNIVPKL
jgi:hypothetical protein